MVEKAHREFKDSVFGDLFGRPEYLIELYKDLHPEDTGVCETDLRSVTLQSVLVDAPYNDLGFVVGGRLMILVEAQSTWSPNITIRALLYLARTLELWVKEHKVNLYSSKKVVFPKPELYVIYTGNRSHVPKELSIAHDFFSQETCDINATVHILRGEGTGVIAQYVAFTKILDGKIDQLGPTALAVSEAIDECVLRGILDRYLTERRVEVEDIMFTLFDQEEVQRFYVEEVARERVAEAEKAARERMAEAERATQEWMAKTEKAARERVAEIERDSQERVAEAEKAAKAHGEQQAKQEAALRMLRGGLEPTTVAEFAGLPLEEVRALANGLTTHSDQQA